MEKYTGKRRRRTDLDDLRVRTQVKALGVLGSDIGYTWIPADQIAMIKDGESEDRTAAETLYRIGCERVSGPMPSLDDRFA